MVQAGSGGEGHQLTVGLQWLGSGVPDLPGGGGAEAGPGKGPNEEIKREKSKIKTLEAMKKKGDEHFRSTFGINIGIAAILKQSQIFTGTIGTLFQILGAFIDVILAAFMPIIVPALKKLAEMIPYIRQAAENIVGNVVKWGLKAWEALKDIGNRFSALREWFGGKFMTVLGHLIVVAFLGRLVGAQKILSTVLNSWFRRPMLYYVQAIYQALMKLVLGQQAMGAMGRGGGGALGGGFIGPVQPRGPRGMAAVRGLGGRGAAGMAGAGVVGSLLMSSGDMMDGNWKRATMGTAAGVGGAVLGGAIGTAILPGIGTAIGMAAGNMLGHTIGTSLSDWLDNNMTANSGRLDGIQTALQPNSMFRNRNMYNAT